MTRHAVTHDLAYHSASEPEELWRPHLVVGQLLVFSAVALTTVFVTESEGQELPPEIQVDRCW